ncbi:DUF645 family protein [Vibrio cholerae]|nr:DUF645 family protein [Vibrio cholerae]
MLVLDVCLLDAFA